jgi:hypothetical protein
LWVSSNHGGGCIRSALIIFALAAIVSNCLTEQLYHFAYGCLGLQHRNTAPNDEKVLFLRNGTHDAPVGQRRAL